MKKNQSLLFRIFLFLLYLAGTLAVAWIFIQGWAFYNTPFTERPFLPDYKLWKPGGLYSHGLGILGSAMMLLLLLYSLRKRSRFLQQAGNLRHWLNVHIFLGIFGPLFVILHSTFKLNGLVAVSFWSMIAVSLSGIIGRYLYIQIPRRIDGHALTLDESKQVLNQQKQRLRQEYELSEEEMIRLEKRFLIPAGEQSGLFKTLTALFTFSWKIRGISHYFRIHFGIQHHDTRQLVQLLKQAVRLESQIRIWNLVHRLFHAWHVFHKPFAIIMYLIMIVHVGIAVWLGYTWF